MIGTTASAEIALRPCACRRALLLGARARYRSSLAEIRLPLCIAGSLRVPDYL
jgi:hypothetical protein